MNKDKWESFKDKGADVAQNLKEKSSAVMQNMQNNPAVKDAVDVARSHPKEAILASLMVLGLIFSFYWLGSLVVGVAAALYIPWNIKILGHKAKNFFEREGRFATFILIVALIFLLIHTFWFIIGLIIGFSVKLLFKKHYEAPSEKVENKSTTTTLKKD
jgi:hypothetical protein